ncbi:hypothetical protein CKA55_12800 [Arcobacter suis]|uniref:Uncharacterized protein n=1 Tax=Arcobacter suis CECT 7833 TaxID=663365 RepID=A0AAD0SSY3_9BACT|nr:hypothetical protein [Arcobacter suis]AXX90500.1 hypothetical protein ASUIS_2052 [Arcobacter suis CECT 7833]RWS45427.1 hypothetical protein CKA55_12800 [Arcobacter suis]
MKVLTEEIEYFIDNNLFFEKVYIHSCPIHILQYIKYYKIKNKLSLNELVDNTLNRYIADLKELKRVYELDEDVNFLYSEKRYKNNISKELLEKLKYKFMNSKLYYLDWIVSSIRNPYLEYFYLFLNSINNSLYIKENQFNNSSTQYNYDNFVNKTKSMRENAENFFDENLLIDSKLHKGIIETYKEDKIEGSMIISSITNKIFAKLIQIMDIEEIDEKDKIILNRNQQFHKKFEYVNFTENEMYNGFAQACFYNYAQARIEQFKSLRKEYNKNKTATIPNFTKDIISKKIMELFNLVLDEKDAIKNIRQNKKTPNILKIYDDIKIYTTKDLSEIDKGFYKFIIENFFDETPKMQNFLNEHKEEMQNFTSQLRIIFY